MSPESQQSCGEIMAYFRHFVSCVTAGLIAVGGSCEAFEPSPGTALFYNRGGTLVPSRALRFASAGWKRGRDQGFVIALQRGTSYFYEWALATGAKELGRQLVCDGNLLDGGGEKVNVDEVLSFTLGKLEGGSSDFLIAVTNNGGELLAWNIGDCNSQGNLRATVSAPIPRDDASRRQDLTLLAGNFDGGQRDLVEIILNDVGTAMEWEKVGTTFRLLHRSSLVVAPGSFEPVRGITYAGTTRLPHELDNVAYESAILLLHDRGYSIVRNGQTIAFAPNCAESPETCRGRTLLFNVDQGFTDGLQDLARKDRAYAGKILNRLIRTLKSIQQHFSVWVLLDPIQEDQGATKFVLDAFASAGIPFVLDYYSSDITNLAALKRDWLDYLPRAYEALKGLSLKIGGSADDPGSVEYYQTQYKDMFAGIRFMERLSLDIAARVSTVIATTKADKQKEQAVLFDWDVAREAFEWGRRSGKYVIFSDPAIYIPYECYWDAGAVAKAKSTRDLFLTRLRDAASHYSGLIPMYDNNEGVKRCGVSYGDWLVTPRNFRLMGWARIPSLIASVKTGSGPLDGRAGFGISVQSWAADSDPLLNQVTLPPGEMAIWTLDAFSKSASIVEFEPYFYFFNWPPSRGTFAGPPPTTSDAIGSPKPTLEVLMRSLGLSLGTH